MPPLEDDFVGAVQTLADVVSAGVSSQLVYEGSICDAYPCWNDGVCIETTPRVTHHDGNNSTQPSYLCMCSASFAGDHCQTKIIDHCASLVCKIGTACIQEVASTCLPLKNFASNSGDLFSHLSSTTANWSFLQTFLLFAMVILIAAGFLVFCYGGNLSCYLLLPDARQRYSKWRDAPMDELSWDPDGLEDDFDDEFQLQGARNNGNYNNAESSVEAIELKTRSMKISTTSETFVSYDPTSIAADDTQQALLPSVIS